MNIPKRMVAKIFRRISIQIYNIFQSIDWWNLSFKSEDTFRSIVDCSEIFIQRPSGPRNNQFCFSSYKNYTTFKVLVGCDENGFVNFCSALYAGSISDQAIVKESGFLDLLVEGDAILADKGFEISDLLATRGAILNLPPFLRGKDQFEEHEVLQGRSIGNRRIIVENIIGRARKMTLLNSKIPFHLKNLADVIIFNSFFFRQLSSALEKASLL